VGRDGRMGRPVAGWTATMLSRGKRVAEALGEMGLFGEIVGS
jgi:hypothetical protein